MEKEHPVGKQEPNGYFVYKSPNTGEFVMAHQYIAEVMVNRKAAKEKVSLPYKYWNEKDKWGKEFRGQVTQAAKLLKTYDSRAIVKAINEVFWCFSLRTPKLIESIKKHDAIIKRQDEVASQNTIEIVENGTFKIGNTEVKKQTLRDKLRQNGPIDFI